MPNHLVFYSGIKKDHNMELVTDGGRVLISVAVSNNLKNASEMATKGCQIIQFEGSQYRKDIAFKALKK